MFSLSAMIEETSQSKNGKFNGVRMELQTEEIPLEVLASLDKRKRVKVL